MAIHPSAEITEFGKTAIVLENFKEAALYFEYLVPVGVWPEFLRLMGRLESKELKSFDLLHPDEMHRALLPRHLQCDRSFVKRLWQFSGVGFSAVQEITTRHPNLPPPHREQAIQLCTESLAKAGLPGFLAEYKLDGAPVICSSALASEKLHDHADLGVTLTSIKVVDADHADWGQIMEFRKDLDAVKKLRRLRLFACDNYSGKPKEYVEDDILNRIAEHDEAVKKWAFETKCGALSTLLNSKLVASALAGSFVSAICGDQVMALASAAGGLGIELARIGIQVSMQRFALRELMEHSPVSYISSAISTLRPQHTE
jgi:hypothetical protein